MRRREGCDFPQRDHRPAGSVYLLGDNRGESLDSRFWGPVPVSWVIGQAVAGYWPPRRLGGALSAARALVGINHVALEVGDVDAALALYGRLFEFELRGRAGRMAFVDIGDQFLALSEGRRRRPTTAATSGSSSTTRRRCAPPSTRRACDVGIGRRLDFLDPWGNRFEIVAYSDIQFERAPAVKRKLGIEGLDEDRAGARRDRRARARLSPRATPPRRRYEAGSSADGARRARRSRSSRRARG